MESDDAQELRRLTLGEISNKLNQLFQLSAAEFKASPSADSYKTRSQSLGVHLKIKLIKTIEASINRTLEISFLRKFSPIKDCYEEPNLFKWRFSDNYPSFPEKQISHWKVEQIKECSLALDQHFLYPVDLQNEVDSAGLSAASAKPPHQRTHKKRDDGEDTEIEFEALDMSDDGYVPPSTRNRQAGKNGNSSVDNQSGSGSNHPNGSKKEFHRARITGDAEMTNAGKNNQQPSRNKDEDDEDEKMFDEVQASFDAIEITFDTMKSSCYRLNKSIASKDLLIGELKSKVDTQESRIQELEAAAVGSDHFEDAYKYVSLELGKLKTENAKLLKKASDQEVLIAELQKNRASKESALPKETFLTPGDKHQSSVSSKHSRSATGTKNVTGGDIHSNFPLSVSSSGFQPQGQKRKPLTEMGDDLVRQSKSRKIYEGQSTRKSNATSLDMNGGASAISESSSENHFSAP